VSEGLDWIRDQGTQVQHRFVASLDQEERNEFGYHWTMLAREAQLPPPGAWRTWLIMAGRGFGKTRAGAEWVRMLAEGDGSARIALVSASLAEARAVMVEGESGLLACSPPERRPVFEASVRRVRWPNGATAQLFSAADPETLRGPQHSHAFGASSEGILCQSITCYHRYIASTKRDRVLGDPSIGRR
jgi:phage terminase large subunit-like protein